MRRETPPGVRRQPGRCRPHVPCLKDAPGDATAAAGSGGPGDAGATMRRRAPPATPSRPRGGGALGNARVATRRRAPSALPGRPRGREHPRQHQAGHANCGVCPAMPGRSLRKRAPRAMPSRSCGRSAPGGAGRSLRRRAPRRCRAGPYGRARADAGPPCGSGRARWSRTRPFHAVGVRRRAAPRRSARRPAPPRRRGRPWPPRRSACGPRRGTAGRTPGTSCPRRSAHR